jgi:malonate transporter and related proteins
LHDNAGVTSFFKLIALSAPLFAIVCAGYALTRFFKIKTEWTDALTKLCFVVLLPSLLFRMMTGIGRLPKVDARLLIAFFGGCLIVFIIGRIVAAKAFKLDGVGQSVFALGGVFSNNVLLGLPLAKLLLGEASIPSVALVLVFNALTLWTLVTVSVEYARSGSHSLKGFGKTFINVIRNPIVAAIMLGCAYGLLIGPLPAALDGALNVMGDASAPIVLFALGMGLAQYSVREAWRESLAMCVIKLIVQPLIVYALALLLGLPAMETRVVVLLASIAMGVNVYLMARQFNALQAAVASSLVLSTALAAVSTPLMLSLVGVE